MTHYIIKKKKGRKDTSQHTFREDLGKFAEFYFVTSAMYI